MLSSLTEQVYPEKELILWAQCESVTFILNWGVKQHQAVLLGCFWDAHLLICPPDSLVQTGWTKRHLIGPRWPCGCNPLITFRVKGLRLIASETLRLRGQTRTTPYIVLVTTVVIWDHCSSMKPWASLTGFLRRLPLRFPSFYTDNCPYACNPYANDPAKQ